jgi:hypothetical protein
VENSFYLGRFFEFVCERFQNGITPNTERNGVCSTWNTSVLGFGFELFHVEQLAASRRLRPKLTRSTPLNCRVGRSLPQCKDPALAPRQKYRVEPG